MYLKKKYNQEEIEVVSTETESFMFFELKLRIPGTVPGFVLPNTLMNGYSSDSRLEFTSFAEEARLRARIQIKYHKSHPGGKIFEKCTLRLCTPANPAR